ncbi:molybdenum cofactor guanylyltransferase MobA [Orbaceae bacterium ESL0721]|nr:molybdenum cofactor guanylyltransferase MobA [Orbaceae bacterium ESL0721]
MIKKPLITATILSGGQGSRMQGQDKGLAILQGKPLYQHVIEQIKGQVESIMISCNRNIDQYQLAGLPIFTDDIQGYIGPISGIYSALKHSQTDWNLIVSCDTPFLPYDLVARLTSAISEQPSALAAYVHDGERAHPTTLLIHKKSISELKQFINQGNRKLILFLKSISAIKVSFSDKKQCFENINTLKNLHFLDKRVKTL